MRPDSGARDTWSPETLLQVGTGNLEFCRLPSDRIEALQKALVLFIGERFRRCPLNAFPETKTGSRILLQIEFLHVQKLRAGIRVNELHDFIGLQLGKLNHALNERVYLRIARIAMGRSKHR